jgi:hypothetical protein
MIWFKDIVKNKAGQKRCEDSVATCLGIGANLGLYDRRFGVGLTETKLALPKLIFRVGCNMARQRHVTDGQQKRQQNKLVNCKTPHTPIVYQSPEEPRSHATSAVRISIKFGVKRHVRPGPDGIE